VPWTAKVLLRGELAVIPTETVYGLACLADDERAIAKVYAAKGRPSDNPLIVHVASLADAMKIVAAFPSGARALAEEFWPGPLTLVLPKRPIIPDLATAGLPTVAIRIPAHPLTLELLRLVGRPLAAPSANRFMGLSPTRVEDLDPLILDQVSAVLDGGPTTVGIESTVVAFGIRPTILRPGGVTRAQIERIVGEVALPSTTDRRSPGQYPKHYSPSTPVRLASKLADADAGLCLSPASGPNQIQMPSVPAAYAARMYHELAVLDRAGYAEIVVERPPNISAWEAVLDRLSKAAGGQ
jgi:L-threonylcarbamoyladenylate synthase